MLSRATADPKVRGALRGATDCHCILRMSMTSTSAMTASAPVPPIAYSWLLRAAQAKLPRACLMGLFSICHLDTKGRWVSHVQLTASEKDVQEGRGG